MVECSAFAVVTDTKRHISSEAIGFAMVLDMRRHTSSANKIKYNHSNRAAKSAALLLYFDLLRMS